MNERTWTRRGPRALADFSFDFVSTTTGFAVGTSVNGALRTIDGGRTWTAFAAALFPS